VGHQNKVKQAKLRPTTNVPIVSGDFSVKHPRRQDNHRQQAMVGGLLLLIIIGGAVAILTRSSHTCSDTVLQSSVSHLNPQEVLALSADVAKIQAINGYQSDPNCMYIVTTYYINRSDGPNAAQAFSLFMKHYDSKSGLRSVLYQVPDATILSQQITFLNQPIDKADSNARER
jgi:hypothetical protein